MNFCTFLLIAALVVALPFSSAEDFSLNWEIEGVGVGCTDGDMELIFEDLTEALTILGTEFVQKKIGINANIYDVTIDRKTIYRYNVRGLNQEDSALDQPASEHQEHRKLPYGYRRGKVDGKCYQCTGDSNNNDARELFMTAAENDYFRKVVVDLNTKLPKFLSEKMIQNGFKLCSVDSAIFFLS